MDAARSVVEAEFRAVIEELGTAGRPAARRGSTACSNPAHQTSSGGQPAGRGGMTRLSRAVFGLVQGQVNTIEEEQVFSNFLLLRDYVSTLKASWTASTPPSAARPRDPAGAAVERAAGRRRVGRRGARPRWTRCSSAPPSARSPASTPATAAGCSSPNCCPGSPPSPATEAPELVQQGGRRSMGRSSRPRSLDPAGRAAAHRHRRRPRAARGHATPAVRHPLEELTAYLRQVVELAGRRPHGVTYHVAWRRTPMPTEQGTQDLFDRVAGLREELVKRLGADLIGNPQLAEALVKQVDDLLGAVVGRPEARSRRRRTSGLPSSSGSGRTRPPQLAQTRLPPGVDAVRRDGRLGAHHRRRRPVLHLPARDARRVPRRSEAAGAVPRRHGPAVGGPGRLRALPVRPARGAALHPARPPRRLPPRVRLRQRARRRPARARNTEFHRLFTHFVNQVALFWRDKRISDVIRERAYDPSFGSIAIVRRAGLDLRNNLKFTLVRPPERAARRGHAAARRGVPDPRAPTTSSGSSAPTPPGTSSRRCCSRYFNERLVTSPRQRMAVTGREVLRWLAPAAHPAGHPGPVRGAAAADRRVAEEWLTSAQSLGLARRQRRRAGAAVPGRRRSSWWEGRGHDRTVAGPGTRDRRDLCRLRCRRGVPQARAPVIHRLGRDDRVR